jgi:hypothetical protein
MRKEKRRREDGIGVAIGTEILPLLIDANPRGTKSSAYNFSIKRLKCWNDDKGGKRANFKSIGSKSSR